MEQTLDQMRKRYALAVVRNTIDKLKGNLPLQQEYINRTRGLSAMILQSGLTQALAFCYSKTKPNEQAYQILVTQIDHWLTGRGHDFQNLMLPRSIAALQLEPHEAKDNVMQLMLQRDMDSYLLATREALEILDHLRHFATAFKAD